MAFEHTGRVAMEKLITLVKTALGGKVDKVEGKGLSTNDLTNELKAKIDGLGAVSTLDEIAESNLAAELAEKVNAASEGNHSHANAEELDKIAVGDKAKWDEAVAGLAAVVADYLKTSDKEALQALISALDGRVTVNEQGIATLNGNSSVEGSVDKKIADAINAWANEVSDNGKIDTIKEAIDYIAAHGTEYTTLVGEVQKNTAAIETLNGDASTAGSVAKQVADEAARAQAAEEKALTDAKAYTDEKNTAMDARVKEIEDNYVKTADITDLTAQDVQDIWDSVTV